MIVYGIIITCCASIIDVKIHTYLLYCIYLLGTTVMVTAMGAAISYSGLPESISKNEQTRCIVKVLQKHTKEYVTSYTV